jgi:hypothetical protein
MIIKILYFILLIPSVFSNNSKSISILHKNLSFNNTTCIKNKKKNFTNNEYNLTSIFFIINNKFDIRKNVKKDNKMLIINATILSFFTFFTIIFIIFFIQYYKISKKLNIPNIKNSLDYKNNNSKENQQIQFIINIYLKKILLIYI